MMIDEKVLFEFLKTAYFGSTERNDIYTLASDRAYRDMCRTINFPVKPQSKEDTEIYEAKKSELRSKVTDKLREQAPNIKPEDFDACHKSICVSIIALYAERGITLTYGQAQKWVNMFFKYICVLAPDVVAPYFDKLHIPFDNIIIRIAVENKAFKRPIKSWSRWGEEEYLFYSEKLNNYISSLKDSPSPMEWEFTHWKTEVDEN